MKRLSLVAAALAVLATAPAMAAASVSINVGEPGFFGSLDIGDAPAPELIYPQPVIVAAPIAGPPLYLHVPVAYAHDWRHHCAYYNACGRRVFFVNDRWYNNVYVPHYREHHGPWAHREAVREQVRQDIRREERHEERREERHEGHYDHDHDHGRGWHDHQ